MSFGTWLNPCSSPTLHVSAVDWLALRLTNGNAECFRCLGGPLELYVSECWKEMLSQGSLLMFLLVSVFQVTKHATSNAGGRRYTVRVFFVSR